MGNEHVDRREVSIDRFEAVLDRFQADFDRFEACNGGLEALRRRREACIRSFEASKRSFEASERFGTAPQPSSAAWKHTWSHFGAMRRSIFPHLFRISDTGAHKLFISRSTRRFLGGVFR